MNDEFDKKREMVAMLMDMLRKSAHDEVSPADKAVSMEKISVSPEMAKELHPDATNKGMDAGPMPEEMEDDMQDMPKMSDGGPMTNCPADESMEEQDEENNSSTPFEALMNRKRRMK